MTLTDTTTPKAQPGSLALFWRSFSQNRGALIGLYVMAVLVLIALFAELIAPYGFEQQFRTMFLTPPVWQTGGSAQFLLGTDDLGRDMLSRLIYGARIALLLGASVVVLSLGIGTTLGLSAAFAGGAVDVAIMRFMDILLVFPGLLLAIVVVSVLGPSLVNTMLAVTIVTLPSFTRLARAAALSELTRDYVTASRCAGAGTLRLMFLVILPNCMAPLIVQATLSFSNAILEAAALGFLGLGAQPPTPEWGTMLSGSLQYLQRAWWMITLPGLAIFITVLAFNLFGDGLRDALDPKLKR